MQKKTQKFEHRQKMKGHSFEIFHYKDAKPESVKVHHHDFYEIYFFLGGDVSYWIEGKNFKLNKGDLLLISPMELHQPIAAPDCPYERIVLWIDRDYLYSLSNDGFSFSDCFHSDTENNINILHTNVMMSGRIAELFELLNRESRSKEPGSSLYADGLFLQLLVEIARIAKKEKSAPKQAGEPSLVSRITSYINNNYNEDISLDNLAKRFFVSKYYLSHEFSREIGIGIYRYLLLKRLSIAKELLAEGVSVYEVASRCGFHNYTTFYRTFKSEFDISPSQYCHKN